MVVSTVEIVFAEGVEEDDGLVKRQKSPERRRVQRDSPTGFERADEICFRSSTSIAGLAQSRGSRGSLHAMTRPVPRVATL